MNPSEIFFSVYSDEDLAWDYLDENELISDYLLSNETRAINYIIECQLENEFDDYKTERMLEWTENDK